MAHTEYIDEQARADIAKIGVELARLSTRLTCDAVRLEILESQYIQSSVLQELVALRTLVEGYAQVQAGISGCNLGEAEASPEPECICAAELGHWEKWRAAGWAGRQWDCPRHGHIVAGVDARIP